MAKGSRSGLTWISTAREKLSGCQKLASGTTLAGSLTRRIMPVKRIATRIETVIIQHEAPTSSPLNNRPIARTRAISTLTLSPCRWAKWGNHMEGSWHDSTGGEKTFVLQKCALLHMANRLNEPKSHHGPKLGTEYHKAVTRGGFRLPGFATIGLLSVVRVT